MKLCPSEADIRPVSRREHYVSDYLLAGIEGCGYKDQACLFIAYHDDSGWCGCSSNYGVYCGFSENLPSIVFTTPSVPPFVGDRNLRSEGENRPTRCSEPLRSKVGGPKRSAPGCAGWDRLGEGSLKLIVYSLQFILW